MLRAIPALPPQLKKIEKIIVWHFGHVTKDGDKVRFSAHSFVFDADVETPATNAILLYNFTKGPSTGALEVRNPSLLVQSCGSGLRRSFMPRWCMRLKKRCWLTTSCVQRLCWGVRFHSWCWAWLHRIFLHWPGRFQWQVLIMILEGLRLECAGWCP